jgi:uncharacterized membrane protein YfcA
MIDYNLVLVMGPNLLIGAFLGASLNLAAPSWLILTLLVVILGHSAWKTWQKGFATLRSERNDEAKGMSIGENRLSKNVIERGLRFIIAVCGSHTHFSDQELKSSSRGNTRGNSLEQDNDKETANQIGQLPCPPQFIDVTLDDADESDQEQTLQAEAGERKPVASKPLPAIQDSAEKKQPQFPLAHLSQFGCMCLVVVTCIFARGSRASPGIVSYCGQAYWLLTALTIVALALLGFLGAKRAIRSEATSTSHETFRWNASVAQKVATFSLAAGTLAALCGIGGGMVMGPILLDLGVVPQVQSATTASTLFVLSSSVALVFLVQGTAPVDYALWLAGATASGAVIGKAIVGYIVKLYQRPSAIIFLLAGVITTSVIVMTLTGTLGVINDVRHGKDIGFQGVCTS